MTLIIVDDQISVLNGLMNNIDFKKIGFDIVHTATNADAVLDLLSKEKIDVLMSDIEMPGKNGLELNSIVREQYPEVLRILLTSHANFSYAQEGLKLGCFDYIVQPAPYPEIEASLTRAIVQCQMMEKSKALYALGNVFDSHKTEFLNNALLNLFSKDPLEQKEGLKILNESGYGIGEDSYVKLVLVYASDFWKEHSQREGMKDAVIAFRAVLQNIHLSEAIQFIIGKNTYNHIVILFYSADYIHLTTTQLEELYHLLQTTLKSDVSAYIGWTCQLEELREVVERLHGQYKNNITRTPELIYVHKEKEPEHIPTSLEGFLERWEMLLKNKRHSLLKKDIYAYLDRNLSNSTNGFSDLCELHQKLTQLFFKHYYENNIDIISLFNDSMTYEQFMFSYNTVEDVKKAVDFLIGALGNEVDVNYDLGYVERAKTYILENTDQNLTVKEVADYISLNPEYFTRLFKKETGYNIKDYIIECKLTAAKELLIHSNLPINMVALELGYSNFSHFTQMFKKSEGITPKEFRMLHKEVPQEE